MTAAAKKSSVQNWFLGALVVAGIALVGYFALADLPRETTAQAAPASRQRLQDIPFNGTQAYEYLKQICAIGPRVSGTPGMKRQQEMLIEHFEKLGAKVTPQSFRARHPLNGSAVDMTNLLIEWHPERKERVLLGAHYDTRPYPDQDPIDPRGTFLGANDGASGVALLMELGKSMKDLPGKLGVDFVIFDGEELIYADRDAYFLGSTHFAEEYAAHPPAHKYRAGVVLDMVGDKNLEIFQEGNSIAWPPSRAVAQSIWGTAKKLGVREFVPRVGPTVNDDHLPLCQKARIPTCDVIDFDYPYWHTRGDTADKCSALSLAKVGWVMEEWLKKMAEETK